MPDYLFFQLAGPMASWGEIAVGEDRASASRPTRSAVIGILASALGIRRRDEDLQRRLAGGYRVAVLVCDPGVLLRDYHTTQVPSSVDAKGWHLATRSDEVAVMRWSRRTKGRAGEAILSSRDYRCDGRWVVALQARRDAPYELEGIRRAMLQPQLTLYLGRKACPPALPLQPQLAHGETMVEALMNVSFVPSSSLLPSSSRAAEPDKGTKPLPLYWEEGASVGLEPTETTERWDDPLSRRRWQFQPRLELHGVLPEGAWSCS